MGVQFPPLPTVGAEARSGFILLSPLAAMGRERPWGRGRERWEGLPREIWQEFRFSSVAVVRIGPREGRGTFLGPSPASQAQGWECPLWLILKKGSSVHPLVPFRDAASRRSQRALSSVLRGREPGLVKLATSSGWNPSYVHTSRGITPSLLLSGGNKDSSSRNLRGKWTRWPWTWVSSDRAKGGLTTARGSTATYSRSVRSERVALDGRQRKIWEEGGDRETNEAWGDLAKSPNPTKLETPTPIPTLNHRIP